MAKKKAKKKRGRTRTLAAVPKGQLGDWGDKVPQAVQEAADDYDGAHTAKTKSHLP